MARKNFLQLVVEHAERNAFHFERWFRAAIGEPWTTRAAALEHLAQFRRYYVLLFSHEFARAFWRHGTQVTFLVPASTYTRRDKDGKLVQVKRQAYTRRRLKPDAWKYHLREMADTEEPLKYIRRFVLVGPAAEPSRTSSSKPT